MAEITNGEFLREKLRNFVKYCRENIGKRCTGITLEKYTKQLDELATVDIAHFTQYVAVEMAPYSKNIPAYLNKMMTDSGVQFTELPSEEQRKLIKYIDCFIQVVST